MSQLSFLNQVQQWDTLHVSGEFVSNGVVAVRINRNNIDLASVRLAETVYRYCDPGKLPEARLMTRLPAINDFPPSLVFAPANWEPSPLVLDEAGLRRSGLCLIAADLYDIIVGDFNVDGDYWSYRCLWDDSFAEPVPSVMVYDVDLDLVGFCAGLRIKDHDQEAVKAVLAEALGVAL